MHNQIQTYSWGTRNSAAFIPHLLGIAPEPGIPYAELWMGTHPKAPSSVIVDGIQVPLDQWIASHPIETLGREVARRFTGTLPFLFKVLSAREALSIQAHPNKAQAERLHARDPEHYPDDNHKPEVAVALDSLTALMGIKPLPALAESLKRYPELVAFIGPAVCGKVTQAQDADARELVRLLLTTLFERSVSQDRELAASIDQLAQRLQTPGQATDEAERLFLDLRKTYSGADVGLFAIFLLNLVHLEAGQGIFVHAGVPHAYLKGNIIECMANSDNVVRVGLTPKFKDAQALIEIMDYEPKPVQVLGGNPGMEQMIYPTPAPEFRVSCYALKNGSVRQEHAGNGPQILLVTQGDILFNWDRGAGIDKQIVQRGQSVFIPAALTAFALTAEGNAEVFKADVPL
ncbi:MAG: mannose-6-phosphate isomerase, class I [Chloroflexi bacterium]|nr:mannose-6-phosphate isomerase, class I [Chloroflexota bacterium]